MYSWVEKGFSLVKKGGYLDRLTNIYPPPKPEPRVLSPKELSAVDKAFQSQDDFLLLETMLDFDKFPFNDPYVSFLRESPKEIRKNPETVRRICARLREMGPNGVVDGLQKPIEFNRRMGAMFGCWLKQKYFFCPGEKEFKSKKRGIAFLSGSGENLRGFANHLGCGI